MRMYEQEMGKQAQFACSGELFAMSQLGCRMEGGGSVGYQPQMVAGNDELTGSSTAGGWRVSFEAAQSMLDDATGFPAIGHYSLG